MYKGLALIVGVCIVKIKLCINDAVILSVILIRLVRHMDPTGSVKVYFGQKLIRLHERK